MATKLERLAEESGFIFSDGATWAAAKAGTDLSVVDSGPGGWAIGQVFPTDQPEWRHYQIVLTFNLRPYEEITNAKLRIELTPGAWNTGLVVNIREYQDYVWSDADPVWLDDNTGTLLASYEVTDTDLDNDFAEIPLDLTTVGRKVHMVLRTEDWEDGVEDALGWGTMNIDAGTQQSIPWVPHLIFDPAPTGKVISVAPEALPHRFSELEFPSLSKKEANALAKKLNDNFDVVERQLLIMDPDKNRNKSPFR